MKPMFLSVALLFTIAPSAPAQEVSDAKFVADTLVVQADGTYETNPDLATLTFAISSQDKELKRAYDSASQSMQRILALADRTGLRKTDVLSGSLTLSPYYDYREHGSKPKAYAVSAQIALKVRDFSQIGPLLDGAVEDNIVEFRSLTYSLQDEEAAKEQAAAQAIQRATRRATAALEQSGQKLGPMRYANLDVKPVIGVTPMQFYQPGTYQLAEANGLAQRTSSAASNVSATSPERITVSATVQCAFAIK